MIERLDEPEIEARLAELPGWLLKSNHITKEYCLKDFAAAVAFVNEVAALAEAAQHHPDIDIRWNKVRLSLSTHSKGGLTALDFDLATQIEDLG
jgi:4a-hydroxytetrahydrobiopterin dehydratase